MRDYDHVLRQLHFARDHDSVETRRDLINFLDKRSWTVVLTDCLASANRQDKETWNIVLAQVTHLIELAIRLQKQAIESHGIG